MPLLVQSLVTFEVNILDSSVCPTPDRRIIWGGHKMACTLEILQHCVENERKKQSMHVMVDLHPVYTQKENIFMTTDNAGHLANIVFMLHRKRRI